MERQFKAFYQELEQQKCYDAMEFRLRFQKKLLIFLEFQADTLKEDLALMKKNYLLHK